MSTSRVLIVDDDLALLEALPEALRLRVGHLDVDTSDSAHAAIEQITATDYDALIVDIKMPGMDGLELLSEIKKIRPDTPTLLITGHGDHELAVQALRAGAYDYVTKPIDREYFVSSLSRAIECHSLSREVSTKRQELLHHVENLEACVHERTLDLRDALHREQVARVELDDAKRTLEEMGRQRETFISMIAHDLAAPVTTMRGYAELLGRAGVPSEAQEKARAVILSETSRLARLVGDLADTAHLAAGQFPIRLSPSDLSEIARQQVELARTRTTHHTIDLEAPSELPLTCDRDRLAQVLSNLLTNAIAHTGGGTIRVGLRLDGDAALLTVSDQGPGIPRDRIELIFEPGRRFSDDDADGRSGGAGLGLHITRGIVEAHGGRIWVESSLGQGATFCIALPLTRTGHDSAPESEAGVEH
jgi:two-component system, sensor histidine kinase and response regulator